MTPYDPLIGRFTQTLSIVDCGVHSTAREITLRSTLFWDRPLTIGNESGWHRRFHRKEYLLHSGVCAFMGTRAILPETSRAQQAQALLLRAEAVSEDI